MGARVIEKHFTNDVALEGPDHHFSMTPQSWREMVNRTRDLEAALGSAEKIVAENEKKPSYSTTGFAFFPCTDCWFDY